MACADGKYTLGGATACLDCPGGYECRNRGESPTKCQIGTSSTIGAATCTQCIPGVDCDEMNSNSGTTSACTSGYYNAGSEFEKLKTCKLCPPGHECSNVAAAPVACASGSYKVGAGAGSCTPCPAGSACPFTDQAPYTCATNYESAGSTTSCTATNVLEGAGACTAGKYAYPNPNECIDCPVGFECPEIFAMPIPCVQGYYQDLSGDDL